VLRQVLRNLAGHEDLVLVVRSHQRKLERRLVAAATILTAGSGVADVAEIAAGTADRGVVILVDAGLGALYAR
jgi:5S rRNA maturation endonuclease (ribonuclease M5)